MELLVKFCKPWCCAKLLFLFSFYASKISKLHLESDFLLLLYFESVMVVTWVQTLNASKACSHIYLDVIPCITQMWCWHQPAFLHLSEIMKRPKSKSSLILRTCFLSSSFHAHNILQQCYHAHSTYLHISLAHLHPTYKLFIVDFKNSMFGETFGFITALFLYFSISVFIFVIRNNAPSIYVLNLKL